MFKPSRRDFLKIALSISAGASLSGLPSKSALLQEKKPNIILLLTDTTSAEHLSFYQYARRTTPNLERLAERAIVYHSHHSGGNFTTPGTASILTGTYPWTNRAFNLYSPVHRPLTQQNIFALLGPEYVRTGFAQNALADLYLRQFGADVDSHIPLPTFKFDTEIPIVSHAFINDSLMASYAVDRFLLFSNDFQNPLPGSLFTAYLGIASRVIDDQRNEGRVPEAEYPHGLPSNGLYQYENRTVYDGVREIILGLHKDHRPYFSYFHLMSPHAPYSPTEEFANTLANIEFSVKKRHPLGDRATHDDLLMYRKYYDEYIANVDAELGRLLDALIQEGVLENTYIILLSDHGEMFERGVLGHSTRLLYEAIIHTPLLVFAPGQLHRMDIYAPTSNVDVLPTLLSLAGRPIPAGVEGRVLPGLGGQEDADRPIFTVEAKENSSFLPLTQASIAMIKGTKKLIYYTGYEKLSGEDVFELYDLGEDPDEKYDLYKQDTRTARQMRGSLLDHLAQADLPFQK